MNKINKNTFLLIFSVLTTLLNANNLYSAKPMNVTFTNISDENLKNSFLEVFSKYKSLHKYKINVIKERMGSTTMKAQPILTPKNIFTGIKQYKIVIGTYIKDTKIKIETLPKPVLKGWFAHELGHVEDYESYTNMRMLWYGMKYFFSGKFKKEVEHKADFIALQKGFKKEILATKKYILLGEVFPLKYVNRIHKYYLPIDRVEAYLESKIDTTITTGEIYHE